MRDLEFTIKTKAELGGVQAAINEFERLKGKAMAAGEDTADLDTKIARAKKSLADYQTANPGKGTGLFGQINAQLVEAFPALGKFEGLVANIAKGPLGWLAAGAGAAATALAAMKRGLSEYAGMEQEVNKLDQALARNGIMTDELRGRLQDLAGEMQRTTGIADEEWLGVMRRLVQFGADGGNIDKSVEAVKNLAGILGGDLQTAAMMVGKALKGNHDMFSRYGIEVGKTGTVTERFNRQCQELAMRGGGQLEAANKGLAGQYRDLKNSINDTFKALGQWVAETGVVQGTLGVLTGALNWVAGTAGHTVRALDGLPNSLRRVEPDAEAAAKAIKNLGLALDAAQMAMKRYEANTANRVEDIGTQMGRDDSLADKRKQRELAMWTALESAKVVTSAQATAMRNAIEDQYEQAQIRRHEAAMKRQSDEEHAMIRTNQEAEQRISNGIKDLDAQDKSAKDFQEKQGKVNGLFTRKQVAEEATKKAGAALWELQYMQPLPGTKLDAQRKEAEAEYQRLARQSGGLGTRYEQEKAKLDAMPKPTMTEADRLKHRENFKKQVDDQFRSSQSYLDTHERNEAMRRATMDFEGADAKENRQTRNLNAATQNWTNPPQGTLDLEHGLPMANAKGAMNYRAIANQVQAAMARNGQGIEGAFTQLLNLQQSQGAMIARMQQQLSRQRGWWYGGGWR